MGHEPRFNATIWVDHPERMTQIYLKLDRGEMPTREEIVDFGEFTGGLNHSEAHQADFVPVGYHKDGANFVPDSGPGPTPPPADPIAAFRARQRVSQNCAWVLITPQEAGALEAAGYDIHAYNQFYTVGGSGGLGIAERPDGSSPSGYVFVDANQHWQPDVNQAADKRVQELADAQGRPVPPPLP